MCYQGKYADHYYMLFMLLHRRVNYVYVYIVAERIGETENWITIKQLRAILC